MVRMGEGTEALTETAEGSIESPRFMWVMLAILFGSGAIIGALSLLVPHPESFDERALWSNEAVAFAGSAISFYGARRWPVWPIYLMMGVGVLAVTRAAYYSHDPSGFYTMFYVWIGLYVVFFFRRAIAFIYLSAVAIAYALLLVVEHQNASLARWVTTIGTIVLAAFLIDSLVNRVRRMAHESASIARERAELMATLAEVARTDDLTGLANRRAWDEAVDRELARAKRDSTPLCICIVDLDRFKDYNDVHGHQSGDRLLKQLAAAWGAELRATDVLARYGGEEFALALPGCDLNDAAILVERLRAATPAEQTASAGLVRWDGQESAERLFGRADKALYVAKDAGRDRIVNG
jgi:diguanylate cyclase (GGDEF)-like protein